MLASTLDVSPLPHESAAVIAYRHESAAWPSSPRHRDYLGFPFGLGKALTITLTSIEVREDPLRGYKPRTELGKRLLALRQAYVAGGGRLLTAGELEEDLRSRRGGVVDV